MTGQSFQDKLKDPLQRMKFATTYERIIPICVNTLSNLKRVQDDGAVRLPISEHVEGAALVVGAGSEIDDWNRLTPELAKRCFVIATSASIGICRERGIEPDALLMIETVHIPQKKYKVDWLFFDLAANQDSVDEGTANSKRQAFFVGPGHETYDISRILGVRPVETAGATSASAYTVARMLGFKHIIMSGCGVAYHPDTIDGDPQIVYAKGAHWEGTTIQYDGLGKVTVMSPDSRDEAHRASGIAPRGKDHLAETVDGWCCDVMTTVDYRMQLDWFSEHAITFARSGVKTYALEPSRAKIKGFIPLTSDEDLKRLVHDLPDKKPRMAEPDPVSQERIDKLVDFILNAADEIEEMPKFVTRGDLRNAGEHMVTGGAIADALKMRGMLKRLYDNDKPQHIRAIEYYEDGKPVAGIVRKSLAWYKKKTWADAFK